MYKKLQEITPIGEVKADIRPQVINSILNFSKSLEVKKIKKQNVLIHLN